MKVSIRDIFLTLHTKQILFPHNGFCPNIPSWYPHWTWNIFQSVCWQNVKILPCLINVTKVSWPHVTALHRDNLFLKVCSEDKLISVTSRHLCDLFVIALSLPFSHRTLFVNKILTRRRMKQTWPKFSGLPVVAMLLLLKLCCLETEGGCVAWLTVNTWLFKWK